MPSTAPIQIFRAGRHTAMSGQSLEFRESDLAAMVAAYDPTKHQAPLVIGHPQHDDPAYGWVQSLSISGGVLEASADHVDPAFAELVNARKYKNVSASFYSPDSPANPVPGVYYLRHVGFLGAQPPAVKGLLTPSFAAGEAGIVEFSEWDDVNNASLWRSMREWVLAKFGTADADQAVPGYLVQSVEQGAQDELRESQAEDAATSTTAPAFAEEPTMTAQEIAALQAENARLKADADALRRSQAELRRTALHAENVAFAEQLGSEGRLSRKYQPVAIAALDALASGDTPVEFGEGEARKPLATAVRELLSALPQSVEFGEVATGARAIGTTGTVSFAAPDGASVDQGSLAIHGKVIAYQSRHKVTYEAALDAVLGGAA